MKKNVFSRTLAVLASTAVLGAASMLSANAAGESLTLTSATGKAGETVTVNVDVACGNNFESCDIVVGWKDTALTAAKAKQANASVASEAGEGFCTVVAYGSDAIEDGTIATIAFTIPEDAEVGTVYDVTVTDVNMFAAFGVSEPLTDSVAVTNAQIEVVGDETEAPTDAPTDAPTAAATTTTAAPSTGAPKTGNAGVAVAVAGLVAAGATAVVLKKRH